MKYPIDSWLNKEHLGTDGFVNSMCVYDDHDECPYGKEDDEDNIPPCQCPCHKKWEDLK